MAGLGYKLFAAGEVLTAANLQGYAVDQSTMVFASSAARTSALSAPSQGMVSWLNDSGTAWQYFELYNASTNPGGATVAGWYPISGAAMFFGTATRSAASSTDYNVGASGYTYTEIIDPLAWHSAVTNTDRIIPNVAGVYRVTATSQTALNVTGNRRIWISKNGGSVGESTFASANTNSTNSASAAMSLNGSTDYVTVSTTQNSGASLTVTAQVAVEFLRPSQS
jgi:hypothetical protein